MVRLDQSRAQRIVWLLEELKVPYDIEIFQRQGMLAPPEGKKIHPLGKFPVVKIDDTVVAESGLITEVLVEKFGPHLAPDPSDEAERLRYRWVHVSLRGKAQAHRHRYFMHYSEGSLMPPMIVKVVFSGMQRNVPFFLKPVVNLLAAKVEEAFLRPNFETHFDFLEKELEGRTYLCSEKLTGADIILSYPLFISQGRIPVYTKERYPNLYAYCDRLRENTTLKKAEEKASIQVAGCSLLMLLDRQKRWKGTLWISSKSSSCSVVYAVP